MAHSTAVTAEPRTVAGSRSSRKLRATGQVPAVVYGHKEANVVIQVSADEVTKMLREGHKVIDLTLSGETQSCIVKDMQWDTFAKDVLHIDFVRVSKGELIQVEVSIALTGDAPGVLNGGVLEQPNHRVMIEVPALQTPDEIAVDISAMTIGDAITVADLKLPDNVTCLLPPETPVVVIHAPKAEEEDTDADAASEPEVIGEKADGDDD